MVCNWLWRFLVAIHLSCKNKAHFEFALEHTKGSAGEHLWQCILLLTLFLAYQLVKVNNVQLLKIPPHIFRNKTICNVSLTCSCRKKLIAKLNENGSYSFLTHWKSQNVWICTLTAGHKISSNSQSMCTGDFKLPRPAHPGASDMSPSLSGGRRMPLATLM